jgi:hypothetical protein
LAQSLGAKFSFIAIGKELGHDEEFAKYARIEGISNPMPPIVENTVEACLQQAICKSWCFRGGAYDHKRRTLGQACVVRAARLSDANRITPFFFVSLVYAVLIGYFLFGETISVHVGLGCSVILISAILMMKNRPTPES